MWQLRSKRWSKSTSVSQKIVTPSSGSQFYLQPRTFGNVLQAMNYYEQRMCFYRKPFVKKNIKNPPVCLRIYNQSVISFYKIMVISSLMTSLHRVLINKLFRSGVSDFFFAVLLMTQQYFRHDCVTWLMKRESLQHSFFTVMKDSMVEHTFFYIS